MSDSSTPASVAAGLRWGVVLALLAALGFSAKGILIKLAYPYGVDAVTLLALRMLFALPVFLWVGLREHRGGVALTRGDWLRLCALGVLGFYGASILDFLGLQFISVGLERLILFTYPMLTLLIGILFQSRPFSWREGVAMVLCYSGIGFAFAHDLSFGETREVLIGSALVLASSICFALYLAGSGAMIARLGSMRFTALAMLVSTGATLIHFFIQHTPQTLIQPWPVFGWVAVMAVFSTIFPVFAQSAAIRRIGASRSAILGMVGPPLTIFLGWWLLTEPLSLEQLIGAGLVILGILVVTRRH